MELSHELLVGLAKSFGLFWLIALSIGITAYAFWPSLGERFDTAANSILNDEGGPACAPTKHKEDSSCR
ncbi:MAG: cbb3-type cytochrome c oxidase subunit 3 [Sulfitobacter sp. SK025]|nr:MAG: cbb3-type cytochrome c oxidase subunit 3 [Sulfitobacter sp. SK025]